MKQLAAILLLGAAVWLIAALAAPASRLVWRDIFAPALPAREVVRPERKRACAISFEARSLNGRHGSGARCPGDLGAPSVCLLG